MRLRRSNESETVEVHAATKSPTLEHRKADRAGWIALIAASVFFAVGCTAIMFGLTVVGLVAGGLFIALLVVGLTLHFDGERQQQRPDSTHPDHPGSGVSSLRHR